MLQYLSESSIIDIDDVLNNIEHMKISKILEQHPFAVWHSESDNRWHTYLPDETKPNNRRPIAKRDRADIDKAIVDYYIDEDTTTSGKVITLEQLYKAWMLYRRDHTSAKSKTLEENKNEWNKFFAKSELAKMNVKEIKSVTITRFFREITKNRDYTYKRISNARTVLNGIFQYAIEEEIIEFNPVSNVNFRSFDYKVVDNRENVYSEKDAITLLKHLRTSKEIYALAIQLDFYLFIRIGELKALKWNCVDWKNRTIKLQAQGLSERQLQDDLSFTSRKVTVVSQMKGNTIKGFRTEYLTDEAIRILKVARSINPFGEYIFMPEGRMMTTNRFNAYLKKYCLECDVSYHSSHKIRFYNASTAYDGKNLSAISKLMGHSQVATTLHYLRNVSKNEDDYQAFENLGLQRKCNQV